MIRETYNMDTLGGMVKFLIKIIKGTFLAEAAGALLFAVQFIPEYGFVKGICYAVFHAVSAFCNAGIDILGDSSFIKYATNPLINATAICLIVVSGIGFTVWGDVGENMKKVRRGELHGSRMFMKLSLHSKIAITMTLILIVGGTVSFFLLEYATPETFGSMCWGE